VVRPARLNIGSFLGRVGERRIWAAFGDPLHPPISAKSLEVSPLRATETTASANHQGSVMMTKVAVPAPNCVRRRLSQLVDAGEAQIPDAIVAGSEGNDLVRRSSDKINRIAGGCFEPVTESGPKRHWIIRPNPISHLAGFVAGLEPQRGSRFMALVLTSQGREFG
jgi:hypothetical protein